MRAKKRSWRINRRKASNPVGGAWEHWLLSLHPRPCPWHYPALSEYRPHKRGGFCEGSAGFRRIGRMVEDERYCMDVLTQLQSVRAALTRVESEVLKGHLDHCAMEAMTGENSLERQTRAGELIELLGRAPR